MVEHTAHNGTDVGSNPAKPKFKKATQSYMQLNFRKYQKIQTKAILKKNNFLLFTIGANQNSYNWIVLEQNLHKLSLAYTKTYNNVTTKIFQDSVARKLKNTINSTFFFLKHKNAAQIIKSNLLNEINTNKFNVIALKLNKRLYAVSQLKTMKSFHYKKNISIMYQFLLTTLKSSVRFE